MFDLKSGKNHTWQWWLQIISKHMNTNNLILTPDLKRTSAKCCSYSTTFTSYRLSNHHSNRFLAKTTLILTETGPGGHYERLFSPSNGPSLPHFTKNTRAHEYLPPSKAIPLIGLRMLKLHIVWLLLQWGQLNEHSCFVSILIYAQLIGCDRSSSPLLVRKQIHPVSSDKHRTKIL